jgi:bacteriocin-like protein
MIIDMKTINQEEMAQISGGDRCSKYWDGLSTVCMFVTWNIYGAAACAGGATVWWVACH